MMAGLGQGADQTYQAKQQAQLGHQLGLMKGLGGMAGMGQFGSQKPSRKSGGLLEQMNQNLPRPEAGGMELQGPMMPVGGQLPLQSRLLGLLRGMGMMGAGQ